MADNIPISGGIVATDDVGGIQYQRVKVAWGIDGVGTDVNSDTPLPVTSTDLATLVTVMIDDAKVTHELLFRILNALDQTSPLGVTQVKET